MSQNFEESPISDTKMDISDTTNTSQDSPAITPDDGDDNHRPSEALQLQANSRANRNSYTSTEVDTAKTTTAASAKTAARTVPKSTYDTAEQYDDKLDNRQISSHESDIGCILGANNSNDDTETAAVAAAYNNSSSSIRNALTLANSHPLMSPPAAPSYADDESVNGSAIAFNYPDVVPASEPLRLAQPRHQLHSSKKCVPKSTLDIVTTTIVDTFSSAASISDYAQSDEDDESEPDISQYQATVTPLFQSVALVSNRDTTTSAQTDATTITNGQRKIAITSDFLSDVSSFDSISNHSFDDDVENNLISASVSSSVFDDTGFNQGTAAGNGRAALTGGANDELATPAGGDEELPFDVPIPQYSASEEARDSRNWQKITLPDGRTRDIDMKVIEPYKRVLSHGGYLSSGGHNAIVVFSACYLPDRSRTDYHYVMDNLFLYVVKTLDQLITDDYVLVYLHGASSRSNVPPFPWLKKCYQLLDRRLRKSLKNLFMVHPTFWLKSVVWMARPFISTKFWKKLVYVRTLDEMYHLVPIERAAVPEKVKKYDLKHT